MKPEEKVQETVMTPVFVINDVTFVPHYTAASFVGPGFGRYNRTLYTAKQLRAAGAIEGSRPLWPRYKFLKGIPA